MRAFTTKEDVEELYEEIDRAMEGFEMPRGYAWDKGERYSKLREEDYTMYFAAIMAVTCVFLLMGVLFESFVLPFSVLFSIPFAFLGGLLDAVCDPNAYRWVGHGGHHRAHRCGRQQRDCTGRYGESPARRGHASNRRNHGGGRKSLSPHYDDDIYNRLRSLANGSGKQ